MGVVYAKSTTAFQGPDGFVVALHAGEVWADDDPIVKARPEQFSTVPTFARRSPGGGAVDVVPYVEQATAAPGEKRR